MVCLPFSICRAAASQTHLSINSHLWRNSEHHAVFMNANHLHSRPITLSECVLFVRPSGHKTCKLLVFTFSRPVLWLCLGCSITMAWAAWRPKSPTTRLFVRQHIQAKNKQYTKAPHNWPFMRGISPDDWCIPLQRDSNETRWKRLATLICNGQQMRWIAQGVIVALGICYSIFYLFPFDKFMLTSACVLLDI